MRILVHNSIPGTALGRFPVLLSVMQELLDSGHEVRVVECDAVVPACMDNLEKDRTTCLRCMARAEKGRALLTPAPKRRPMSKYLWNRRLVALRQMRDELPGADAIRAVLHHGADIGYAALSTYSETTRDPEPDMTDPSVNRTIQNLLNTARITYEVWRRILKREKPDRVILFNGRLAIDRGVLRVCQQMGVHCQIYEVSSVIDRIWKYDNALPQDIDEVARQIEELWSRAPADREDVAEGFYRMRRAGASWQAVAGQTIRTNERPYVGGQESGLLPAEWSPAERNIAIFSSSDDEYSAISAEWDRSIYRSQAEGVRAICRGLEASPKTRVYLRLHPRLTGMDRPFIHRMFELQQEHENLTVIPPGSPVSSYAVLDACDIACSFRSTMVYESTFWGKPSVAMANSIFCRRGASYDPDSHAEVMALLGSDLSPRDRLPTLKYGYYRLRMGIENKYFRGGAPEEGSDGYQFKGDPILIDDQEVEAYGQRVSQRATRWLRVTTPW